MENLVARWPVVGSITWLGLYATSLPAMHASELAITNDVQCDDDPRRGEALPATGRMKRAQALDEDPTVTAGAAKGQIERQDHDHAHNENGKGDCYNGHKAEGENSKNADMQYDHPSETPDS
jgi:hypothetical protein